MAHSHNPFLATLRRRGWTAAAGIYLLLAAFYIISVPGRVGPWFSQPFLGTFIEPGMMVAAHGTLVSPHWREAVGILPDSNQLVALDGETISVPADISRLLKGRTAGDVVTVQLKNPAGQLADYRVPLSEYTLQDRLLYFNIPLLVSLLFLGCAGWVLVSGWNTSGAAYLSMCNASAAVAAAGFFDVYATHQQLAFWCAAIAIGGGSLLHTALNFPDTIHLPGRWKDLRFFGSITGAVVVVLVLIRLLGARAGADFLFALRFATLYTVICLLAAAAIFFFRRLKSFSPYERDISTLFLVSSLVSFLPVTAWWIIDSLELHIPFSISLFIPAVIFPLVSGYTIQHTHSLETDYRMMRIGAYTLISLAGGLGYALLAGGIGLMWVSISPIQSDLVNGILIFLMALFVHPVRRAALTRIEPFILQSERAFQDRIQTFSRELTRLDTLSEVERIFRLYIEDTLHPERMQVFLYEQRDGHYASRQSDLVFSPDSPLVSMLANRTEPLFIGNHESLPTALKAEASRLALLNLNVFLPLPGRQRLTGWAALSPRPSGKPYSSREMAYLESLCDRVALTIERALTGQELQLRVRELDALAELARAVSFSYTLEDLAATIYHQTVKAFHAQDFRLVFLDPSDGGFRDLYQVVDGQLLSSPDHGWKAVASTPSLEMDVLRSGRAVLSDDYTRESLKRGSAAGTDGIYSWMGAPLKIEDQVTGGLFIGNRDPAAAFTLQQLNLLQAFASQVSGSIRLIHLLAETQKQAGQLSALNDLSRQVVSTLDLDQVLESVLTKAVSLTGGEAGSILLIDPQTHELVFRTATGPVAGILTGKRLPEGSGIAGMVIKSRKPVVIQDVHQAPEWLPQVDEATGFSTRALVAEPLLVKGELIGVIEIISGDGREEFVEEDLHLLASYAAQASMAIDNARLYSSLAEEYRHVHQARREFTTTIAHELKNPMTSIRGYAELLASGSVGEVNEQQAGFLSTILANVERMNRLVSQLNDLSKFETGRLAIEIEPVSFSEAMQSALSQIKGTLKTHRAQINLPAGLENLPPILADRGRLVQVLENVLHNAIAYSPPGSTVIVEAGCEESGIDQQKIHMVIQDEGPGIAPEDETHLFEKYYRSSNPAVRAVPGIGLSLHLARTILELQAGQIWYEKHPVKGSRFHVTLPVQV